MNEGNERMAVTGCLLNRKVMDNTCECCEKCGWNPLVAELRKRRIRMKSRRNREHTRLTAARKKATPDPDGWYSVKKALPDPGERVIITDGVFVGEAYLSSGGTWKRYGIDIPVEKLGIFAPIAWRPMPEFKK